MRDSTDLKIMLIQGIRAYSGKRNYLLVKPSDPLLKVSSEILIIMFEFLIKVNSIKK